MPAPGRPPARRDGPHPPAVLSAIAPGTIVLAAGAVVLLAVLGVPLWLALPVGLALWAARVVLARRSAGRRAARPARIDPFALREPWRFFVRDALQARARFADALTRASDGPVRDTLADIGTRIDEAVETCWAVARRGQELHDAARAVDRRRIEQELARLPDEGTLAERRRSLEAQLGTVARLEAQVTETRERLQVIDARLEESVTRSIELATRTGSLESVHELADTVDRVVLDLEALRLGLDEAGGASGPR
jgi:type IV secretory pathway TrbD component